MKTKKISTVPKDNTGFPAGTLVHTKDGLVPIEKIQVGDWVLSKAESGEGEREYKRITQTFVHENREVILLSIGGNEEGGELHIQYVFVTPEHPVWVNDNGWKAAGELAMMSGVELLSSSAPSLVWYENRRVFVTDSKNIAWVPIGGSLFALDYNGWQVDVNTFEVVSRNTSHGLKCFNRAGKIRPDIYFRTTVHNLEIDDFNTYYVGNAGLRVHT